MKKLITILFLIVTVTGYSQRAISGKINVETVKELIITGDATKTIKIVMLTGDTIYGSFTDLVGEAGEGDNWGTQVVNRDNTLKGNGVTPLGVDTTVIATIAGLFSHETDPIFSSYQNLISIGGLANSTGYLRNNGSGTFSYVSSPYTLPTASTSVKGGIQLSSTSSGLDMIGDIMVQNDNNLPIATPVLTDYIGFVRGGTQSRVTMSNLKTLLSAGGTVTSVAMTVPTGFSISGTPITSSGTLGLTFATGYSLPSNTQQNTWTNKQNAYTNLTTFGSLSNSSGYLYNNGSGVLSYVANTYTLPVANGTTLGGVKVNPSDGGISMTSDFAVLNLNNLSTQTLSLSDYFGFYDVTDLATRKATLNDLKTLIGGGTGTVTSVTAGDGMTQTGTSTINPTLNIVSHAGTAGSIGTINIGADAIGVNLGSTSTTAMRGDNGTAAYNDKINSAAFSGTSTKTLTLTQQDGGVVTASFTDNTGTGLTGSGVYGALTLWTGSTSVGYNSGLTYASNSLENDGGWIISNGEGFLDKDETDLTGYPAAGIIFFAGSDNKAYAINDSEVRFDLTNLNEPLKTVSATGTTALTTFDKIILVTGAATVTLTYPTVTAGKIYTLRNTTASAMTVPSYIPIGTTTASTSVAGYGCVTVVYNGSTWYQID